MKQLLSLIAIVYMVGCINNTKRYDQTVKHINVKDTIFLKGNLTSIKSENYPIQLFIRDSLLILGNSNSDFNLEIFSIKSNSSVGKIIPFGNGPDEALSIFRISFDNDSVFWAYDVVSQLFKRFRFIKSDQISSSYLAQMKPKGTLLRPLILTKTQEIIATTPRIDKLSRFDKYDFKGSLIGSFGNYPNYGRKIPSSAIPEVYSCYLGYSDSEGLVVAAYEYTDLIEIYNRNLNLVKSYHGPHRFFPDFDLKTRGNFQYMKRSSKKTREAFKSVSINNSEMILLYSGRLGNGTIQGIHYQYILKMNTNGSNVSFYKLDHAVSEIAVDWKNRVIYGLNRILEPEIYTFEF